jgi:heme/copper-type cytochrome/quinol oxidase subunit 3
MTATTAPVRVPLSTDASRPAGWWGMVLLIATEGTLFFLLAASYFYLRHQSHGSWPPAPLSDPKFVKPLIATLVLAAGSVSMVVATRSARIGHFGRVQTALLVTLLLAIGFLAFEWVLVSESLNKFRPQDNAYGSIYYTLIGVHWAHTAAGALGVLWALLRSRRFTIEHHLTLRVVSLYVHFVNVVAVVVFVTLYVVPRT